MSSRMECLFLSVRPSEICRFCRQQAANGALITALAVESVTGFGTGINVGSEYLPILSTILNQM